MTSNSNPTERFSNRVADYVNYRPHYPQGVLDLAHDTCGLQPEHIIADIGSGTGFLSELFLRNGNAVYGVEPNREMREAGERVLESYPKFTSIDGTAEATTLPNASVDLITAGQAFHWFDAERAKAEFCRILRPHGYVMLVWNQRRSATTPFLVAYEELLRKHGTEYETVCHRAMAANNDELLQQFFAPDEMHMVKLTEHSQNFNFEGMKGRLLSSSYMPREDYPGFETMMEDLRKIFDTFKVEGRIRFEYDTMIYYGQLDRGRKDLK